MTRHGETVLHDMEARTGKKLWDALHSFAGANHSTEEKAQWFETWLAGVHLTIGCESCFKKLQWFLTKWPTDFEHFFLWSICFHDYVNKELGKPLFFPKLTLEPLKARGIIQ